MEVIKIIWVLVLLWVIYSSLMNFKNKIYYKFKYNIFDGQILAMIVIAYVLLVYGMNWYHEALANNGDTLNGILLICIAAILIIIVFIKNFDKTNFINAIYITFVQLCLGVVTGAVLIFLFIMSLIAYDSRSNSRY
jgi:hypothetical protein